MEAVLYVIDVRSRRVELSIKVDTTCSAVSTDILRNYAAVYVGAASELVMI